MSVLDYCAAVVVRSRALGTQQPK